MIELPFKIDLTGKTVVVTGGSGVLGSVMARALAACGGNVVVLGRSLDKAQAVAEHIVNEDGNAIAVAADVLNRDSLAAAYEQIRREYGNCDILVNCAGGNHPKANTSKDTCSYEDVFDESCRSFYDLDINGISEVFNLNFIGTLLPTQIFTKEMVTEKCGGVVINISSMSAFSPLSRIPAYSGAKAAVSNFTRWLAVHFAPVNIRVNAIAPGFFLTEQNRSLLLNENGELSERAKKIIAHTPMGRFGTPSELLGALLFLVDNKSGSFVNGTVIPVDGGFDAYSGV
ncbi:MAG: SDR family oxidoreductase [Victivallaceae bacterium]